MSEPLVPHLPVLYHEIILALMPRNNGRYIDATLGAGGHAYGILEQSSPDGLLLGLDRDPLAIEIAGQHLAVYGNRARLIKASYIQLLDEMKAQGWDAVDGIVFDLGVSSMQIDTPQRGFSFLKDGPLDMRFDPTQKMSASDLVNDLPEKELADLIWKYGEERYSRRIAAAISAARPLTSTIELANVIRRAVGGHQTRIHPATRTFQALRIAVNEELRVIEQALPLAIQALSPGGRLAVISFHSMEDRIVKLLFHQESRDCICPPEQPVCICGHVASIKEVTHRPMVPGEQEIDTNPRARSAKLRIAEKLP